MSESPGFVHRTARVGVRATPAQARRLYGVLRLAGDVWAALIELNRDRAQRGAPPEVNFQALCRELTAGINVEVVDERGTSSTCPACGARQKPRGRLFACRDCGLTGHRDLVGAANIARRTPGGTPAAGTPAAETTAPALPVTVKHRRAGRHLPGVTGTRRDRRRHQWDIHRKRRRRVLPGSGPPPAAMGESHAPHTADVDRPINWATDH